MDAQVRTRAGFPAGRGGRAIAAPVYHRILVPLDHTELDRLAVSHAAAMGKLYGARIYLLHVEEGVTSQVYGQEASTAEVEVGEEYLERIAQSLRDQGVSVETAITHSASPTKEILRYAKEINAGSGDHGRARARRAEGFDLRHHNQPGAASSGRADADRSSRKGLKGAAFRRWDRLSQSCVTGEQENPWCPLNLRGINKISWHVTCS